MMEFPRQRSPVSTQMMPQQWHDTINTIEGPRCTIKQSIPINKLPAEILLLILEMLRISDINSMTRVNHCWNAHAIPVLYKTAIIGCYGTNAADSEAAVRNFNSVTFCNEGLYKLKLVQHLRFYTSSHYLSPRSITIHESPNLKTLTLFSLDRNCHQDSYYRMLYSVMMPNLQSIHIGLRCETAELQFPKLFSAGCVLECLPKLEMIRYSRLRTKSETTRMGEAADGDVVVEDALGGGPLVGKYDGTMTSSQIFSTYVHHLSALSHLKTIDLDLGITPDSFVDLRGSLPRSFTILSEFLIARETQRSKVNRKNRLMLLSKTQFHELITDFADEITRRNTFSPDGHALASYLEPVDEYSQKRNQVRAKFATVQQQAFEELAADVHDQILTSYPQLSVPGYRHLFEPTPPFGNDTFDNVTCLNEIEQMRLLRLTPKGKRLRDIQVYCATLMYESITEYGMDKIEKLRIRMALDGPWMEVLIYRDEKGFEVEVVTLFSDLVISEELVNMLRSGQRWGCYTMYRNNQRTVDSCALLEFKRKRWCPVTHT
ncbi:hypothetical protein DFP73DRAFT_237968 [Morchella snyderi]|nr:hypothetical protein DFP73DRAFT_237968 [Morchella snyderi]